MNYYTNNKRGDSYTLRIKEAILISYFDRIKKKKIIWINFKYVNISFPLIE